MYFQVVYGGGKKDMEMHEEIVPYRVTLKTNKRRKKCYKSS